MFFFINTLQHSWKVFLHLVSLSVCAYSNSRKCSSNFLKLVFIIQVYYSKFHIKNCVHRTKDLFRSTQKVLKCNLAYYASLSKMKLTGVFWIYKYVIAKNSINDINISSTRHMKANYKIFRLHYRLCLEAAGSIFLIALDVLFP